MDRHLFSIDAATTQKIYLDIWRNIKNRRVNLSYPNLLEINKIAYSEVVEKVCLQIISRDGCIITSCVKIMYRILVCRSFYKNKSISLI